MPRNFESDMVFFNMQSICNDFFLDFHDEAADEMTSFIDQYADRFLNQI
jgi:hypothetical protein